MFMVYKYMLFFSFCDNSFEMETVKLLDGGFSTQLSVYVGDCVDGDPLWSAKFLETNKSACIQTHRDFIHGKVYDL